MLHILILLRSLKVFHNYMLSKDIKIDHLIYLFAIHGSPTVKKKLFDKTLDNDTAFEELKIFLN